MKIKIIKVPISIVGSINAKNARLLVGVVLQTVELDDANIAIVSIADITTYCSEKGLIFARDDFAQRGLKNNQLVLLPDEYKEII